MTITDPEIIEAVNKRIMEVSTETKNPILQTMLLIEDRIDEVLESREYAKRSITTHGKLIFLRGLLRSLQRFYNGNF